MAKAGGKQSRRERREQRKKDQQVQQEARKRNAVRRRNYVLGAGVCTAGGGYAAYQFDGASSLLGIVLLAGCGLMLTLALGGLGSGVEPRDRSKSGNIDYGR